MCCPWLCLLIRAQLVAQTSGQREPQGRAAECSSDPRGLAGGLAGTQRRGCGGSLWLGRRGTRRSGQCGAGRPSGLWVGGRASSEAHVSPCSRLPKRTGSWQEQAWELGHQMRVGLLGVRHQWTSRGERVAAGRWQGGAGREAACTSREQV